MGNHRTVAATFLDLTDSFLCAGILTPQHWGHCEGIYFLFVCFFILVSNLYCVVGSLFLPPIPIRRKAVAGFRVEYLKQKWAQISFGIVDNDTQIFFIFLTQKSELHHTIT